MGGYGYRAGASWGRARAGARGGAGLRNWAMGRGGARGRGWVGLGGRGDDVG